MNKRLRLTMSADLDEVPVLAATFEIWASQAGLPARVVFAANLAIEELVVNVIKHGLCDGDPRPITLLADRALSCLTIELRDRARAFDPFQVAEPDLQSGVEARPVGGLGVHFVRSMMDDWSYTREGDENVVRLRKILRDRGTRGGMDEPE